MHCGFVPTLLGLLSTYQEVLLHFLIRGQKLGMGQVQKLGMGQVQNGRMYIMYRSWPQKNIAEEYKNLQTTVHLVAILLLNLLYKSHQPLTKAGK